MDTNSRAKVIMVQGTMSNAGKSIICAGLCRVLTRKGYKVAPFKSQNMALNSYITKDGKEIGRAQAVQAFACNKDPDVRMNPILLKPTTNMGSQVILMGEVLGNQKAMDYFKNKKNYIPAIMEAFESLAKENDIIVVEGAGSPVELNLKENDIVNMGLANMLDASVLLVGDIDRGGVFAQLYGTVSLLEENEKARIKGLIINKFRGDVKILEPAISMIEDLCNKTVVGIVPYADINIEDEDSLANGLNNKCFQNAKNTDKALKIAIIRSNRISNYTDFDPLKLEQEIIINYVDEAMLAEDEGILEDYDLIILPGSKNTIEDLKQLKKYDIEEKINKALEGGSYVLGICGGYQMLGNEITDPYGVEGEAGTIETGLGFLPVNTILEKKKNTRQSSGIVENFSGEFVALNGLKINGYEIHMGNTAICKGVIKGDNKSNSEGSAYSYEVMEFPGESGCIVGRTMGTYYHGILENDEFRAAYLNIIRKNRNKELTTKSKIVSYEAVKEMEFEKLADIIEESVDMEAILKTIFETADSDNINLNIALPYKDLAPKDIENKSFEIITRELVEKGIILPEENSSVIKRVIHTTADFEYVDSLCFSDNAVKQIREAIRKGACIVTDTQMAKSGINKSKLAEYGSEVFCFMSDDDIRDLSKQTGKTRAYHSMDKAAKLNKELIFVIGNAPTALIRLNELMEQGVLTPKGIIGVPVGFVNVCEAKELIINSNVNYIVARGRKGGSNVAAAIVNAILYGM